ncbi:DNA primase [Buchnera aphidicola]|uniref:DNA primase n=1 Tax=Buchnera aphidicola TaxID=9 RepID=UPI00346497E8
MNHFIPKEFIQEILKKTNIIDIIHNHIKIKKFGKNYQAICPFHNENQPSFTINTEKQYFYCFGCHSYGNIIDFLMKYNQLTFVESVKELANINGLKIPYKKKYHQIYYEKIAIYQSMKIISNIYCDNIQSKNSQKAQLYLKKRNIHYNTIKYFEIGYCNYEKYFLKKIFDKNQIPNLILGGVLINNKENNKYDRFQGRITFPIKDKYGRITGFGGRAINNKTSSKYINSPTTSIFNKGNQLYGIYEIYKKFSKPKYLIVVEGYFDVISLTQYNIKYTVASLGTVTTKKQIQILFNISQNIIYCYDGDESGKNAAWNTFKIALSYMHDGYSMKFIFLPDGEDPDSIIHKEGEKKFKTRIKNAINMIDFFLTILLEKINLSSIDGKLELFNKSLPLINQIPSQLIKLYFQKEIGNQIGITDAFQLEKIFSQKKYNNIYNNIIKIRFTHIKILISLIIQNPTLINVLPKSIKKLKSIDIKGFDIFLDIISKCKKYNIFHTGQLIEIYRQKNNIFNIIKKLAYWDNMIDSKNTKNVFLELIIKIYRFNLEKKYNFLILKDQKSNLNKYEKYELWKINKILSKKIIV